MDPISELASPFVKRLKEAIARAGISQKQLGIRCDLDPSVASSRINHYCVGRHHPNFNMLTKMATALDVPVAYFFAEDEMARLILAAYSLSPRRVKALIKLAGKPSNLE